MTPDTTINPDDFVISRRRKKYKFAHFANLLNCYEVKEWQNAALTGPFVVELGAGTGYFSVELARLHPDRHYVSVDVKADRLQAGARRATAAGLPNISFVRAHADHLVELFSEGSISELWLTFSDPFPKKRQAKHRLTHPKFLAQYEKLLQPQGSVRFKTDNHTLFDWSLEQLVASQWSIDELTYDLHDSETGNDCKIMTTYEKRYVDDGLSIYFLSAHKNSLKV